jgi:hypothetical protein
VIFLAVINAPAGAIGVFGQWQDSDDYGSGYGLGLKKKYQIIPVIAAEARVSWLNYGTEGQRQGFDMFPLEAVGRARIAFLYGGLGVGYYLTTGGSSPDSSFGTFLFGGTEFTLFGLGAFAELRYLHLEPGGDRAANLNGLGASVGVILPLF